MARKSFGTCTYCRREMQSAASPSRMAATRDHVMPKVVGGHRCVRACRQCNELKGDIHPSVWRWITENYPAWWKSFASNRDVILVCSIRWGGSVRASIIGRARRDEMKIRVGE